MKIKPIVYWKPVWLHKSCLIIVLPVILIIQIIGIWVIVGALEAFSEVYDTIKTFRAVWKGLY